MTNIFEKKIFMTNIFEKIFLIIFLIKITKNKILLKING